MADTAQENTKALSTHERKEDTGMFGVIALSWQLIMLPFFFFADYDTANFATMGSSSIYNLYVGVALMMFVGFGYLMTFLKAHGLSSIGFTMLITCAGVQWALLVENWMHEGLHIKLEMWDILNAVIAVAAVLISFGGLIGKISPSQVVIVTFAELVFYSLNKVYFLEEWLEIKDVGGTIVVHVFGAYFGLAACFTLGRTNNEKYNGSSYNSDLFSFVGTVFLWLFWPSFVAGLLPTGTIGHWYAVVNTVFALLGSTVVTFGLVPFLTSKRLAPVPIQNATLAGGVAIGATANFAMGPGAALLIGCLAGVISCVGFCKPLIPSYFDTCGINNLHGMPGIFGALVSAIMPIWMKGDEVGEPLKQIAGLVGTLVIAMASGAVTGAVLKKVGSPVAAFNDESYWECDEISFPEEDQPKTQSV